MSRQWNLNQESKNFIKKLSKIVDLVKSNPKLTFDEASRIVESKPTLKLVSNNE